jgi:hypothetical protein
MFLGNTHKKKMREVVIDKTLPRLKAYEWRNVLYLDLQDTTTIDADHFKEFVEKCTALITIRILSPNPEIWKLLVHTHNPHYRWYTTVGYEAWIRTMRREVEVDIVGEESTFTMGYIPDTILYNSVYYTLVVPFISHGSLVREPIHSVYECSIAPSWLDLYYTPVSTLSLPDRIKLSTAPTTIRGSFSYLEYPDVILPEGLNARIFRCTGSLMGFLQSVRIKHVYIGEYTILETMESITGMVEFTDGTKQVKGRMQGNRVYLAPSSQLPSESQLVSLIERVEKQPLVPMIEHRLLLHDVVKTPIRRDSPFMKEVEHAYANILAVLIALEGRRIPRRTVKNLLEYVIGPITDVGNDETGYHLPVIRKGYLDLHAGFRIKIRHVEYAIRDRIKMLGEGVEGKAYVATTDFGDRVVKIVESNDPKNEIKAVQHLMNHPGPYILRYFGTAYVNHRYYIAMELCAGVIAKAPLNRIHTGTVYLNQLHQAVHHLHSIHMVHTDIHEENVFWMGKGCERVVLADFGRARVFPADGDFMEEGMKRDWIWATEMFERLNWIRVDDLPYFNRAMNVPDQGMFEYENQIMDSLHV